MVGNYITSFIGFFPANNPQVVLYVAIDNPKGITAYGGTVAAPIFKSIAEDIIPALKIELPPGGIPKEYRFFDIKYLTVPNVIGLNKEESRKKLKEFQIEYSGTGDKIIATSPEPNTRVPANSIIRLMLG